MTPSMGFLHRATACSSVTKATTASMEAWASIRSPVAAATTCSATPWSARTATTLRAAARSSGTDLNWTEDRIDAILQVTFAANIWAGTGIDLNTSAENAIAAAYALAGGGANVVAAQFTFGGRTYLAIDQAGTGTFDDLGDLLFDVTGVTGTIAAGNFL
jgi:hypothetical protein